MPPEDPPSHPTFRDVDSDPLAPQLVDYLLSVERRADMARMHALAAMHASPPPGGTALDAGCGVGGAAIALGKVVGPAGTVIGLDSSEAMLAVARSRAVGPVRFAKGDITEVPFPDDEFDLVRCERVLQHVPDADAAVRELVRVCRPEGQVLLLDTDWESLTCDGVAPELVASVHAAPRTHLAHPGSGRELGERLVRAGCTGVRSVPHLFRMTSVEDAAGLVVFFRRDLPPGLPILPDHLRDDWFAALDEAQVAGRLRVGLTAWVAAGRKPSA